MSPQEQLVAEFVKLVQRLLIEWAEGQVPGVRSPPRPARPPAGDWDRVAREWRAFAERVVVAAPRRPSVDPLLAVKEKLARLDALADHESTPATEARNARIIADALRAKYGLGPKPRGSRR